MTTVAACCRQTCRFRKCATSAPAESGRKIYNAKSSLYRRPSAGAEVSRSRKRHAGLLPEQGVTRTQAASNALTSYRLRAERHSLRTPRRSRLAMNSASDGRQIRGGYMGARQKDPCIFRKTFCWFSRLRRISRSFRSGARSTKRDL